MGEKHQEDLQKDNQQFQVIMQDRGFNFSRESNRLGAWYALLNQKGIIPFDIGQYKEKVCPNAKSLIIITDTKQEENHMAKTILPYNPMQIIFDNFEQINQDVNYNLGVENLDINFGFSSETNARLFCNYEFYENPVILVYSKFSGTTFQIKALCKGIFYNQVYLDNSQTNYT